MWDYIYFSFFSICLRREKKRCQFAVTPTEKKNSFKVENAASNMVANSGAFKCANDFIFIAREHNLAGPEVSSNISTMLYSYANQ